MALMEWTRQRLSDLQDDVLDAMRDMGEEWRREAIKAQIMVLARLWADE